MRERESAGADPAGEARGEPAPGGRGLRGRAGLRGHPTGRPGPALGNQGKLRRGVVCATPGSFSVGWTPPRSKPSLVPSLSVAARVRSPRSRTGPGQRRDRQRCPLSPRPPSPSPGFYFPHFPLPFPPIKQYLKCHLNYEIVAENCA